MLWKVENDVDHVGNPQGGYKRLEINELDQNKLEFMKLETGYSTYVRNSKKSLIIKLG